MSKQKEKEFRESRTSWRWFERSELNSIHYRADKEARLEFRLFLEILKELQHLNDKKSNKWAMLKKTPLKRGTKQLKRSPLKRGTSQLKRSPLNRIGRQGKINIEANQKIAEMWEEKGIDSCEIGRIPFPRTRICLGKFALQNVHRHKRVWYRKFPDLLHAFKQVLRGCQNCHDLVEDNEELREKAFRWLRAQP